MTAPNALLTSNRQDYETPRQLFEYIQTFLGVTFVVDFAAADHNALCPLYYTAERSAFGVPWEVPQVCPNAAGWCNPPYGDKAHPVSEWFRQPLPHYNYVFLIPCNKMDQQWVWDLRYRAAWVKIIGRVSFQLGGVPQRGNSQGSTLLCLGPHFNVGTTRYIELSEVFK